MIAATALVAASACQPLYGRPGPFAPHAITDYAVDGYGYGWTPATDSQGQPWSASWDGVAIPRGVVSVSDASGTESGNSRQVVAGLGTQPRQDGGSCITIYGPLDNQTQPGVALRIRTDGARTRAITVTDNIIWGARNGFNVHLADSAGPTFADQMRLVTGFFPTGFATSPTDLPPLPWRLCARVTGQQVQAKVWAPARVAEPAYSDSRFAMTTTVPPDWVFAGLPGFYMGHVASGETTSLGIDTLEQVPG
jgi:hypothetical protein